MILINCQQIDYKTCQKVYYSQPIPCPSCKDGLGMWRYGYRLRKVKDFYGETYWIKLPKYRCQKCGKIFLTLPSFLIPYKQYDLDTLTRIQNGITDGCGASYLSIYFWSRYAHAL